MRYAIIAALLAIAAPTIAAAHHGWAWASDAEFTLAGRVKSARHGNPHGTMVVAARDGDWTVEIGQPWRNERAGLTEAMLRPGTAVTVHGHRSAKAGERLMKAERIVVAGRDFNLYPDRPS